MDELEMTVRYILRMTLRLMEMRRHWMPEEYITETAVLRL